MPPTWPANPFCLIILLFFFFFGGVPFFYWLFLLHLHFHQINTFFSLPPSPCSFYTLAYPPKSVDHLSPHFSFLLLSFLQTTPQPQTTSQFNHCTSESYKFLCSHLFVLLENPHLAFILFIDLTLPLCKKQVTISSLPLFVLKALVVCQGCLESFSITQFYQPF